MNHIFMENPQIADTGHYSGPEDNVYDGPTKHEKLLPNRKPKHRVTNTSCFKMLNIRFIDKDADTTSCEKGH